MEERGIRSRSPFLSAFVLPLVAAACSMSPPLSSVPAKAGEPRLAGTASETSTGDASERERVREAVEANSPPMVDSWTFAAQEDGASCREDLTAAGVEFRALPDKTAPDKSGCGIPHAVVVWRGPTGIVYEPAITVDCSLARALGSFERIVQEEAETNLGERITKIGNFGAYACRPRNSRKGASLSAHAFGTAVDVSSFQPRKGAAAVIVRDYAEKRSDAARDARQRFLRGVYARLRNHEADLTYAVGPDFNASHRDHFHLDRGGWWFWFHR